MTDQNYALSSPLFWVLCFVVGFVALMALRKFKEFNEALRILSKAILIVGSSTAMGFIIIAGGFLLVASFKLLFHIGS